MEKFIFKIVRNTNETIDEMFSWRYEKEYEFYNFAGIESERKELMSRNGYAVFNKDDVLIGFCVYGDSATVDCNDENAYVEERLDIGFGLSPKRCGQGLGHIFVKAVMDYGSTIYKKDKFRLSVASFNKRAIKAYEKLGFIYQQAVIHIETKEEFFIMIL